MRNAIDTIEYKGFEIGLFHDEIAESPREWDNLGTMLCLHPRYATGDKHNLDAEGIIEVIFGSMERYKAGQEKDDILALPLVLLDHSGLWMKVGSSFACDSSGWDTSQVGYIYVTHARIKEEMARPLPLKKGKINPDLHPIKHITKKVLDRAERVLRDEVEVYSSYLEGAVYGWVVEGESGEEIDSCWGYYGDEGWKRAIEEAKGCIDYRVNDELYQKRMGEQRALFE